MLLDQQSQMHKQQLEQQQQNQSLVALLEKSTCAKWLTQMSASENVVFN